MSEITDEMLMAYADGVLDAAKIAAVEVRLAGDPELARRFAHFERTSSRMLAPAFEPLTNLPVPERLLRAAGGMPVAAPAAASPASDSNILEEMFGRLIEGMRGLMPQGTSPLAAAFSLAALVVLGGYGAQLLARQVPEPQPFRIVLETAQSNSVVRFKDETGERSVMPVLSFQDKDGRFCRKYEVTRSNTTRITGVACRDANGDWKIDIEADAGVAPKSGDYETVGANAVDDRIVDMIKGDALDRSRENEQLKKGWK